MASARERRAALQRISEGSSDSKAAEAPAGNPADAGANPAPSTKTRAELIASGWFVPTEEEPMKIQFQSVYLDIEIPRLPGGNKGLAASSTTFFDITRTPGVTIELDTASQLVKLSNDQGACFVPLSKVTRFGDVLTAAATTAAAAAKPETVSYNTGAPQAP